MAACRHSFTSFVDKKIPYKKMTVSLRPDANEANDL
jgi:hypothetical protein